jgi:phage repressor protein C with HTH and peptisase S24 domain
MINEKLIKNRRLRLRQWIDENLDGVPARLVELIDINQGELSGLLRSKSFGEKKARSIEIKAGMPSGWLDSVENYSIPEHEKTLATNEPAAAYKNSFSIKKYDEVGGSMGRGIFLQDQPGQITNIDVTDEWIEKNVPHNTGKMNLGVVTGFGDSMLGMFNPGDPILVDSGVNSCSHDGVYFFRIGDEGFIKRLQRIPGEGIRVISKNTDYESWTITENMDFEVLGKVLIVWESAKF